MKRIIIFTLLYLCYARDIILSAGLGNFSQQRLSSQYETYKLYAEMELITTASILVYNINIDGSLGIYNQNDLITSEKFQYMIKDLGLKALPCLFCDSTIGACGDLSLRLENLFKHEQEFINETIYRAKKYGWEGYSVDFESYASYDIDKLTDFIINWQSALNDHGLILSVWIGALQYNYTVLFNTKINLVTMATYNQNYEDFVYIASQLQSATNISNIGYGFLTKAASGYYEISGNELMKIIKWLTNTSAEVISIWSSIMSTDWYDGLRLFMR